MEIGYFLSSEEHLPNNLVRFARRAEEAGFSFAVISDHYHPWIDAQGQSAFVWSVIGGISQVTQRLRLGTGVTCPTMRIHPAIIAQAAATAAAMMPGRFFLGVGSGENLNEHIFGDRWPPTDIRLEMMEEALEIIRLLWQGGEQSYYGAYYTVEDARIYTLPEQLPPIYVAASGKKAAELAGQIGDGLIATSPNAETTQQFEKGGGKDKPRYGKLDVCLAATEAEGRKLAHKLWPTGGLKGQLNQELRTPGLFEQAAGMVTEDDVAKGVVCSHAPQKHLEMIQKYVEAGYDHIFVQQIGPDQEGFFRFYEENILPELTSAATR